MNILILNWKDIKNSSSGGAEIVTHEHAKRWVKAGHRVTWLCSSYAELPKQEKYDGISFYRFGSIYTVYLFAPFFYLFAGLRFDAVVDEVHGVPFFSILYCRKPILVLVHEVADDIWDYTFDFPINSIGKFLELLYLFLYRNKTFWTDAGSTVEDLVKKGIPRNKCFAIPCPSNANPLSKIPVKNKNLTVVTLSRIVKMKGIEDVIDAFALIQEKSKNAELWVLGDGDPKYVQSLKNRKIANLNLKNRIKFWGFVSEPEKLRLLSKAHLLLHASVKEGWGLVVIEAASQATPSVVYNVEGLRDSVKDQVTGVLTKKNTPRELANEALGLIADKQKYRNLQKNSLHWAKSLNWNSASKQSLSLLESIK